MADLPTAYPLRDLFDAAALWWLFERKGWRSRFREVVKRFYCRRCLERERAMFRGRI